MYFRTKNPKNKPKKLTEEELLAVVKKCQQEWVEYMGKKENVAKMIFDKMVADNEMESDLHHEALYLFISHKLFYIKLPTVAKQISEAVGAHYYNVHKWIWKFKRRLLNELFVN